MKYFSGIEHNAMGAMLQVNTTAVAQFYVHTSVLALQMHSTIAAVVLKSVYQMECFKS